MKKAIQPQPATAKPPYPAQQSKKNGLAKIFNEWARRYADDPKSFSEILDGDGNPIDDYGDRCAEYFCKLEAEMDL
jgi:hypothetical protein